MLATPIGAPTPLGSPTFGGTPTFGGIEEKFADKTQPRGKKDLEKRTDRVVRFADLDDHRIFANLSSIDSFSNFDITNARPFCSIRL